MEKILEFFSTPKGIAILVALLGLILVVLCFYRKGLASYFGNVIGPVTIGPSAAPVKSTKEIVPGINIVLFFAPWCGHCQAFEPEFKQFSSQCEQKNPNVNPVIINGDENNDLMSKYNIKGFPTVLGIIKDGQSADKVVEYTGPRSQEGLSQFVQELTS